MTYKINIKERERKHPHFGSQKLLVSIFLILSFFLDFSGFFSQYDFRNKHQTQNRKSLCQLLKLSTPKQIFLCKLNCSQVHTDQGSHTCAVYVFLDFLLYFKNRIETDSWKLDDMCKFPQHSCILVLLKGIMKWNDEIIKWVKTKLLCIKMKQDDCPNVAEDCRKWLLVILKNLICWKCAMA